MMPEVVEIEPSIMLLVFKVTAPAPVLMLPFNCVNKPTVTAVFLVIIFAFITELVAPAPKLVTPVTSNIKVEKFFPELILEYPTVLSVPFTVILVVAIGGIGGEIVIVSIGPIYKSPQE